MRLEGERHGFRVLVMRPDNAAWAQKIQEALEAY
ncbi:hypothetical protein ABIB44_003431 [Hymenobacter sp. UYCo722]